MEIAVQLGVGVVFGAIVAVLAQQRGRSALGWFFVGFFTGCIGLILVLVLPDQKVAQERERRLAAENRRLKEQLRKDRMVADQRHGDVSRRLQVHDTALGVDTAPIQALPAARQGAQGPQAIGSTPPPAGPGPQALQWWYVIDGTRHGPIPFSKLQENWNVGIVDMTTMVWATGMGAWVTIGDHDVLREALDG